MATKKVLSGFTVYVDGIDYVGVAMAFTPPPIELAVEESDMLGHGGSFDIPTGRLSKLEATLQMGDAFPALEQLVGNPRAVETPVLCVGVLVDGIAQQRRVEYELSGVWTKQEAPELGGGGAGGGGGDGGTYTIGVRVLTHRIDGGEVRHVDLEANIHRINGTDVNAELRTALRRRP